MIMKQLFSVSILVRFRHLSAVCCSVQDNIWSFKQLCSSSQDQLDEDFLNDSKQNQFLHEICSIPNNGHQVFVIQPQLKSGPDRISLFRAEMKLAENCALVETLPKWKVVKKTVVPLKLPVTSQIFSPLTFSRLTEQITATPSISAVLIGVDQLKSDQFLKLQQVWAVPVFDRYTIVLQIFKDHARSKEAKLQVALAEIPYIRSRLSQMGGNYDQQTSGVQLAGGTGNTFIGVRRQLIQERELKLKNILKELKGQRSLLRRNRQRKQIPSVAVVGYTNAGKTALIKALTGDSSLIPKDQLFATLDVTAHAGRLPNKMTAVFIDTVGFISDTPLDLINAFAATLEDAVLADVIVHVRDISHPDTEAQHDNVIGTLRMMLSSAQMSNIIEVYNKVDLIPCTDEAINVKKNAFLVSATTGKGLAELQSKIQDDLIASTGQLDKTFRIPMDGEHLRWLYKEATVKSVDPDTDNEHLLVNVIISTAVYAKFKAQFSSNNKR